MSKKERFAVLRQSVWRRAAQARLSGRAWSALVVLCGYADQEGRAFPGLAALAGETGIEPRDIPRVIGELVLAGLVVKIKNGARSHGRPCNLYQLTTVQITDGQIADGESTDGESAPLTTVEIDGESYQGTDQDDDAPHHPCTRRDRAQVDADFDEAWKHYPRKKDRGAALRAYRAARARGVTAADILAGVQRYAAARDGMEPRFTKFMAGWLRDDRHADEPDTIVVELDDRRRQGGASVIETHNKLLALIERDELAREDGGVRAA